VSETGTARIMLAFCLWIPPEWAGRVETPCWCDGLLVDGNVCRRSRVERAYMVPGPYMPCRKRVLEHLESSRQKSL